MKIRKPFVTHDEFEGAMGGDWSPIAHTHVKADITDTPWAWADVLKAGSNLTDLVTRQHAGLTNVTSDQHHAQLHEAEHEVGGGDLIAFADITGFGTYLDQAVKQTSDVQFDDITSTGFITTSEIKIEDDHIWDDSDNEGGAITINNVGKDGGVTQFKNFAVHDGKGNIIAKFIGSTRFLGLGKVPTVALDVDGTIKATTFYLNLGGLLDVNLGSLEEGETIMYDQATAKWIDAWGVEYDNPRLVWKMYTDFFSSATDANDPWVGAAIAGGSSGAIAGTSNHPGIIRLSSIASVNTGYRFLTAINCIRIAGAEHSEFVFRTGAPILNLRVRLGFQDSITSTAPTDGVWIDIAGTTLAGKTRNNGAESTTGTSHAIAASTWYRAKIAVNNDATLITYILYNAAGAQLWSNTLAANIPTAAGRETGHGIVMFVAAGVTRTFDLDMMIATRAGYVTR